MKQFRSQLQVVHEYVFCRSTKATGARQTLVFDRSRVKSPKFSRDFSTLVRLPPVTSLTASSPTCVFLYLPPSKSSNTPALLTSPECTRTMMALRRPGPSLFASLLVVFALLISCFATQPTGYDVYLTFPSHTEAVEAAKRYDDAWINFVTSSSSQQSSSSSHANAAAFNGARSSSSTDSDSEASLYGLFQVAGVRDSTLHLYTTSNEAVSSLSVKKSTSVYVRVRFSQGNSCILRCLSDDLT